MQAVPSVPMWLASFNSRKSTLAVVLALLVGVGLASYVWARRYSERQRWVAHSYQVQAETNALSAAFTSATNARRGYVLTGDESMLGDFDEALRAVDKHLSQLRALTTDNPRQQQRLDQLKPLMDARIELLKRSLHLSSSSFGTDDEQLEMRQRARELDAQIKPLIAGIQDEEAIVLQFQTNEADRVQRRFVAVSVITYLAVAGMLVFLFLRMTAEVSRRTRAEEIAKENEERFRMLVNNVQDYAIIRLGLDGNIITWNRGAERMFGYTAQEIVGKPLHHLFQTCDGGTPARHLSSALLEGHLQDDCQQVRKDGSLIWVTADLTLLRNVDGQPHGYALVTRDITERRQHLKEIEQRDAQLNAFFSNAPVGLAIIDRDMRFQRLNGPFSKLNGLNPNGNTELYLHDANSDVARGLEPLIRRVATSGDAVLNHEVKGHSPATPGMSAWWLKSFFPIVEENGAVTQIGVVVQDITALKRAENTVRWLSGRLLQSRDDERRRLARDLHDSLGQILTAVKMNLSYLGRDVESMDERGRNAVAESKELIDGCIKEVRTLSHLLHPPMLDEVGLLPAIRWFVNGFSQRSGIHVNLELPATLRRLPIELEIAVFRAVQETLTNVHRHSGSATATVRLSSQNGEIQLEVSDEGCGIPPQKLAARPESSMIGIGILGMRERMRQLGGQLEISSASKGTSVYVSLPMKEVA